MGYPLNTHNSENSLIVAKNGKTAYYTSDNSGFGQEDIFVFELPENMQAEEVSALEVDILTQKEGEEVVLKNVTFATNSFALEESSFAELNLLITYLKKNPNLHIEIQGHTDDVGSKIDNQILSEQRAKVVFEYLSAKVENKLTYKGFGESQPLGEDKGENRRTSFVIFD
jgi:outer membrane protein OmpA-like peptidoglycan-associated protein